MSRCIVWFRRDLRLADNPALHFALTNFQEVFPVFIWAPNEEQPWEPGAASRWWLHHSLAALSESLLERGSRLLICRGSSLAVLKQLSVAAKVDAIVWNRLYEPRAIERDAEIKKTLRAEGISVESFNGSLLVEPWELQTASKGPYQVFTPFWRKLQSVYTPSVPRKPPKSIATPEFDGSHLNQQVELADLQLLPRIPWDEQFYTHWQVGESGAREAVKRFLAGPLREYKAQRDYPDVEANSSLSPHLHFGEISPQAIWAQVEKAVRDEKYVHHEAEPFLRQLGWRDFAHHLLYHFPETPEKPLRSEFSKFPWHNDEAVLRRWQRGQTGYPLVDAGMRELWATGTMHNRVRMVVASFLVKHLLQPWQAGAAWFWDTLVDADLANNTLGWQWTAGCGADAAPYFRIFNPIAQGEKFDAEARYIKRWVPELSSLPTKYVHRPWEAPNSVLLECGLTLGKEYPAPIVDHAEAREDALEAYDAMRANR